MKLTASKLYFVVILAVVAIILFYLKGFRIFPDDILNLIIAIVVLSSVIIVILIIYQSFFQKVAEEQAQARSPI
jgi:hypothetical protein